MVSETDCIRHRQAAGPDYLTDNPGNIDKVTTTVVIMEIFVPLMAIGDSLTDV